MIIARCPICGSVADWDKEDGDYGYYCSNDKCKLFNYKGNGLSLEKWNAFDGWRVRPADGWKFEDLPNEQKFEIALKQKGRETTDLYNTFTVVNVTWFEHNVLAWKYACKPPEVK